MPPLELVIEKLVSGGQGLAKKDNKTYLVWNALPGETVRARILTKARSVYEAVAEEIREASSDRIPPKESHALSCSPWQILSFESENLWKQKIAAETYERLGGFKNIPLAPIASDATMPLGYRNKIEYGFVQDKNGLSLSFFERGTQKKLAVSPCLLAKENLNVAAQHTLTWLRKEGLPERCLKNLIVRGSGDRTIAGLFLNESLGIRSCPALEKGLQGFQIFHGPKKLLEAGDNTLETALNGVVLSYGLFSFFQIHAAVFQTALKDMARWLDPERNVIDYYCGVGAISIALKGFYKKAALIDENAEAVSYAKKNIERNSLENCQAVCSPAETMARLVTPESFLILDPPRAGLEAKLLRRIVSVKPRRILYLSCDTATHARDLRTLSEAYTIPELKLYNFFPRTPHIEALAVLEVKC